jgi:hypothetical protein
MPYSTDDRQMAEAQPAAARSVASDAGSTVLINRRATSTAFHQLQAAADGSPRLDGLRALQELVAQRSSGAEPQAPLQRQANDAAPVVQRTLADLAAAAKEVMENNDEELDAGQIDAVRTHLIDTMRPDFTIEYQGYLQQDRNNPVAKPSEIETALREYVKALTSSLQAAEGWKDVAILHKRESREQGPPVRMRDERDKYSLIGHHTYREWGMGTHAGMEQSGQIYGPAAAGLNLPEGGGHTWGANAAWLLGHMHAGHRFVQVVPHTEDNLTRGTNQNEVGALAYEALALRQSGYAIGEQEPTRRLWTEFTPPENAADATFATLGREQNDPGVVHEQLAAAGLTADNIDVGETIAMDASLGPDAEHQYHQQDGWHDGVRSAYTVRQ